jgi:hypothetical protein
MTGQQLPTAKYKAGQVSSAIWKDEIQTPRGAVTIYRVTIQRRYKDKNGEWRSSGSFNRNEIPLAIHCLRKAFEKIIELQNEESGNGNDVEEFVA